MGAGGRADDGGQAADNVIRFPRNWVVKEDLVPFGSAADRLEAEAQTAPGPDYGDPGDGLLADFWGADADVLHQPVTALPQDQALLGQRAWSPSRLGVWAVRAIRNCRYARWTSPAAVALMVVAALVVSVTLPSAQGAGRSAAAGEATALRLRPAAAADQPTGARGTPQRLGSAVWLAAVGTTVTATVHRFASEVALRERVSARRTGRTSRVGGGHVDGASRHGTVVPAGVSADRSGSTGSAGTAGVSADWPGSTGSAGAAVAAASAVATGSANSAVVAPSAGATASVRDSSPAPVTSSPTSTSTPLEPPSPPVVPAGPSTPGTAVGCNPQCR